MTIIERARLYIAKCPPSISGSGGHNAAFTVACALVKGFDLSISDARGLMNEWNRGCKPPWNEAQIEHKLNQANTVPDTERRGYLIGEDRPASTTVRRDDARSTAEPAPAAQPKPAYDETVLRRFAKGWEEHVDLVWLANRSHTDPALVPPARFLELLYTPREKVIVFTDERSQGQAVWPDEALPAEIVQPHGVWFLAQPVDGKAHPNPRTSPPKMSRRSEEAVTAWRYLVIESDRADLRLWLGALAQLPLKIAAIYTSGGRSVPALVRVDCATKGEWDDVKRQMAPGLVLLGADPGAMTAVRLTRLPGYIRGEKRKLQKLLYIAPQPLQRPLIQAPVLRDVEAWWSDKAFAGIADGDDDGGRWIEDGLNYYASRSAKCRAALEHFKKGVTV